jgi:hypothetical protein
MRATARGLERVSCGLFAEFLEAGDGGGDGEEGAVEVGVAFVADGESSVAVHPGDRAFDDPAVAAEFLAGFDAFAGDAHGDALLADPAPEVNVVVGLVAVELGRLAAAWLTPGSGRDLIAGMAMTKGVSAAASLVLAADTATDSGIPARSDKTWILDPFLPRSTGFGPVMDSPFWP